MMASVSRPVAASEGRQVPGHRVVEVEPTVLDELHDERGRERLAHRSDLEERACVDVLGVVDARRADAGGVGLSVDEHPGGDAGHAGTVDQVGEHVDELGGDVRSVAVGHDGGR